MNGDNERDAQLEIAHVLFADIVGYSKLLTSEQRDLLRQLNEIVRATDQFRAADAAGKLVRLPTGDGMALAFFTSPDAPVRCALQIAEALKNQPKLPLRIGIHSGLVDAVSDVNDRPNVAGTGINLAQRVMDCGDAGHILLSKRAADDLAQHAEWRPRLRDLGDVEVKHGVRIGVTNLCFDGIGNPALPEKLKRAARAKRRRTFLWIALGSMLLLGGSGAWLLFSRARSNLVDLAKIPEKSVAVLPLENLSDDKSDAFFADGIQDDILTSLAKISDLKVISRTSVMQYRAATRNLRDIGQALGVANILEGSVRRVGNRVLVSVQLIDALHDRHLWAERYDRTLTDSIGLQGELATEIAHALRAKLDPEETARLATRPTINPEAYVFYLKARDKEHTAASKEDGIAIDELYGQAVALDPKFALAVARQSMWNSIMYHVGRAAERKIKAHALATEALRLAPDLGEAHLAQGIWFFRAEKDFDAALKEFSIAAQTMSNEPELLGNLGVIYRRQGRWREALEKFQRVQELDPSNADPYSDVAETQFSLRDWHAAAAQYRHVLEIAPNDFGTLMRLASVLMYGDGDLAAAKAILQKIPNLMHDAGGRPTEGDTELRWELCMLERDFAAAQQVLVEFPVEEFPPPDVGMKTFDLACTALARGDTAAARTLFEKVRPVFEADAQGHPDDPKFKALLGLLYAYLGRKEDALRESRRATELCPVSKDAVEGPGYLNNLALVYAVLGETEKAVTLLQHLLTTPASEPVTLAELRLSWKWDPLRSNPRFQKILAGPEPKTVY